MIIYFPYWDMVSFIYFANIVKSQRGPGIFFLAAVVPISLQHQEGQLFGKTRLSEHPRANERKFLHNRSHSLAGSDLWCLRFFSFKYPEQPGMHTGVG